MKLIYTTGPNLSPEPTHLLIAATGAMPILSHANVPAETGAIQSPSFWCEGELEILRRCDALYLTPGWQRLPEYIIEQREAEALGMTIFRHEDQGIQHLKDWLAYELAQGRS